MLLTERMNLYADLSGRAESGDGIVHVRKCLSWTATHKRMDGRCRSR
ncbi:hypothetical protein F8B43_5648 [Methylorubrum populi]|uniref:Uncharacterized protein n=1 Tax=Methylorubrum populi TaxID=223967 RepID=A0A833J0I8_9HYPH|nr:hypothetical protein F8B43_5648 [Methylorubrum populi]